MNSVESFGKIEIKNCVGLCLACHSGRRSDQEITEVGRLLTFSESELDFV